MSTQECFKGKQGDGDEMSNFNKKVSPKWEGLFEMPWPVRRPANSSLPEINKHHSSYLDNSTRKSIVGRHDVVLQCLLSTLFQKSFCWLSFRVEPSVATGVCRWLACCLGRNRHNRQSASRSPAAAPVP